MTWIFEKVKGDRAIYAICPVCNFHHVCGTLVEQKINKQYTYCPMCGEYLYDDSKEIEVVCSERSIADLVKSSLNWEIINKER